MEFIPVLQFFEITTGCMGTCIIHTCACLSPLYDRGYHTHIFLSHPYIWTTFYFHKTRLPVHLFLLFYLSVIRNWQRFSLFYGNCFLGNLFFLPTSMHSFTFTQIGQQQNPIPIYFIVTHDTNLTEKKRNFTSQFKVKKYICGTIYFFIIFS